MHNAVTQRVSGSDRARLSTKLRRDGRSWHVTDVILRTAAVCIAPLCIALFAVPSTAFAATTVGGCAVFPENNYWNTPIDTLPLHPSSTAWVSSVGATARLHADWGNV